MLHLVVLAVAGVSLPVYVSEQVTEGILYFAPPPVVRSEPVTEQLTFVEMPAGGLGAVSLGGAEIFADGPAAPRGDDGTATTQGNGVAELAPLGDTPRINIDSVYFPDEVDNPAAYDPRSAAPAYPDSLQSAGIEGSVTVQFIVDTLGRAAPASLFIVNATHPHFAQSVQDALPRMLFRPAELTGVKIRQLVQQTFTFRLPARAGAQPDSLARLRPPDRTPGLAAAGLASPSVAPPSFAATHPRDMRPRARSDSSD